MLSPSEPGASGVVAVPMWKLKSTKPSRGAGRLQQRHHRVARVIERREEVRGGGDAAERRRRLDDVRLVDVPGIAGRRRRVEPAGGAAAAHAEVEVEGEVAAHHAFGVRIGRARPEVAIGVLEELGDLVGVGVEHLEAVAVAGGEKVPACAAAPRAGRRAERDQRDERRRARRRAASWRQHGARVDALDDGEGPVGHGDRRAAEAILEHRAVGAGARTRAPAPPATTPRRSCG